MRKATVMPLGVDQITTPQLRVPENWPAMWWGPNRVRMSCAKCGTFNLYLNDDKSLACTECGIAGLKDVQQSMNAWEKSKADARAEIAQLNADAKKRGESGEGK